MNVTKEPKRELSDPADALQRINDVLRLSRSAIWEVDRDGVFTYVSPSFEDLLGYRPEEVVGVRNIDDFYPPDLPANIQAEISRDWLTEAREFTNSEVPLLAKSGQIVWVASDGKPVFDRDGNLVGFRGADTDVTHRKTIEDRLVRREIQLMDLIASAPVAMAYTLVQGRGEMIINKAFEQLFGYASKEVPTIEDWFRCAYPDESYRDEVRRRNEDLLKTISVGQQLAEPGEYRITCKDGRVLEVEISAAMVGGCFVGTFVDVTARQRTLERTRAERLELRAVLDNLPFPVAMSIAGPDFDWTDPRAKVSFFNHALTELLGYALSDVPTVSDWVRACFPSEEYRLRIMAQVENQVQQALAGQSDVGPFEAKVTAKDGRVLDVVLKAVAVGNQLVIALEDQTERNRTERLLAEQREQLARVGRVSALGQLAASLAHELDQPLGAILNNAEAADLLLAGEQPQADELRAIVRDIIEDDRRAGDVLDRIRAMVQKQPFRSARVDVPELFREVGPLIKAAVGKKPIALEISCEPGLRPVEGDFVLLQQALLNLVLNSVDAIGAREDGVIAIRAGDEQSGCVGLCVRDNAGGVPEVEQSRLLEPFHSTKKGGLGMGLAIVDSIVEQHGGRLLVENQPGRGLAVSLILPAWQHEA